MADDAAGAVDAVSAIMQDHRVMERLFERCRTEKTNRPELVAEIKARLSAHATAEEERVYGAIAEAAPSERDEVHHGVEEHRAAEELLARVEAADPHSREFDSALKELVEAVSHHVEEEESDILPTLEDAVDRDRLEELGAAFEERRIELLVEAGIDAGPWAPDDLSDMTEGELPERAREVDLSGRPSMDSDELARALRD
jgi:hemerythrin superfamily protein